MTDTEYGRGGEPEFEHGTAADASSGVIEVAGYIGTPAQIAARTDEEAHLYDWSRELFPARLSGDFPLSVEDLLRWRELLLDTPLRVDEKEARYRLTDLSALPDPETLSEMIDAETTTLAESRRFTELYAHPEYPAVSRLPEPDRQELKALVSGLSAEMATLERSPEPWMSDALSDIRHGRVEWWTKQAKRIRFLTDGAFARTQMLSPENAVRVGTGLDLSEVAELALGLREHLKSHGPLKLEPDGFPKIGAFSPRAVKDARPVFEQVRIGGRIPVTAEDMTIIRRFLAAQSRLDALDLMWPHTDPVPGQNLWDRIQRHLSDLRMLYRVLGLAPAIQQVHGFMSARQLEPPDWGDTDAVAHYAALVDAAGARDSARHSADRLTELEDFLAEQGSWRDSSRVVTPLALAVAARDLDAYRRAYDRAWELFGVKERLRERDALADAVDRTAPTLAEAVLSDPYPESWEVCLRAVPAAWNWARASDWVRGLV